MIFRKQLQLLSVIVGISFVLCYDEPEYTSQRTGCPGCPYDLNINAEGLTDLVEGALQHIESERPQKYALVNIIKAQAQVVSGYLYILTIAVVPTVCTKEVNYPCPISSSDDELTCTIKYWVQPWTNKRDIIENTCTVSQEFTPKIAKAITQATKTTRSSDDVLSELESQIIQTTPLSQSNVKHYRPEPSTGSYRRSYQFVEEGLEDETRAVEERELFDFFKHKYGKSYSSPHEHEHRLKVFKDNLRAIRLLNKFEQGTATYGLSQFADLTKDEFSKRHGLRMDLLAENEIPFADAVIPDIELPTEFDWRSKNVVTEVKNQGNCGSCWAFSTTGNVEGQYAIKYGKLVEFSEQELVDCDKIDEGCNGGLMDNAYRAIESLGGLETEKDYPYEGDDEKCSFIKSKTRVQLKGALNISHDETEMAKWLVANGPISIAINANAMQFYMGGISHPWKFLCDPGNLDHGVLIVGYGVHKYQLFNKTMPYWIVKNSWGPSWGEQGYYRVFRGEGTCGLNQTPSSAIVA